jgi:tRNA (cmo5U34)-methyltransferase
MKTPERRNFDDGASHWDEEPRRVKLANDVAATIRGCIPLTAKTAVLDYGCGTVLVSIALSPFVGSITGVDGSRGMLDVFDMKIRAQEFSSITTEQIDMNAPFSPSRAYDLLVCSMTLHHVPDVPILLKAFYECTSPGGRLCIADLDPEEGRFHDNHTGVFHDGFERRKLCDAVARAGYTDVTATTAAEVMKTSDDGAAETFSIFLITGKRV